MEIAVYTNPVGGMPIARFILDGIALEMTYSQTTFDTPVACVLDGCSPSHRYPVPHHIADEVQRAIMQWRV